MARTENDISKLPQWARTEIAKLRADLADTRKTIAVALGQRKTRIEFDPYRDAKGDPTRVYLREEVSIRYHLSDGYIDVKLDGDSLSIRARDALTIFPSSSNLIDVINRE